MFLGEGFGAGSVGGGGGSCGKMRHKGKGVARVAGVGWQAKEPASQCTSFVETSAPVAIYKSAPGAGPEFWAPASECPEECFLSAFGHFKAQKAPKKHSKSTLRGTPGRCPELSKKHSVGHFQAQAPEHSCKWRPGSQR